MPYEAERLLEHAQRLAVSRGWQRLQAMLLAEQVRVRLQRGNFTGLRLLVCFYGHYNVLFTFIYK